MLLPRGAQNLPGFPAGQPFVHHLYGQANLFADAFGKTRGFFRHFAARAVHIERQADDDVLHAMFVGEFAGDIPWVHLDIAGTRWSNEEKPYQAKGPTGASVRALVHLLMNWAK